VLVVEDESLVAMLIERALEEAGYQVTGLAATAEEALRLAHDVPPDCAIVDISLGASKAGLEVGRRLAAAGVTVLYASAYGVGYRQEMEDMGGRACLHKPFVGEEVPMALDVLARLSRGEAPGPMPAGFSLFVD
jgi:DNA-binding response OmpR family regulator